MNTLDTHPELIPSYEPQRLAALQEYQVLSQPGKALFDTLVAIVARLFGTPVALLSLVGAESVEFVGNTGLPGVDQVARPDSLCSVAILQDGITLYEDLLRRPCHLTTPAAAQELDLHFYAGSALRSASGYPIGALCVMDRQPRPFSMEQRVLLDQLGTVAMHLLELNRRTQQTPEVLTGLREALDQRIAQSLDRIGTLAGLAQWEEAGSPAARAYQQSSLEEATHVARVLDEQVRAFLAQLPG